MDRTLLQGGIVLTSDPALGVLWPGDVLVEGERIAAVGPSLAPDGAQVIDVSGRIVLPGFVDTHRHTWQSIVRTIASDWTLTDYFVGLHSGLSKHFRAQDTYIGNLLGALEALDSGITTLVDWSHNLYTPEHADAAVAALKETRMRAVFAHGGGAHQWSAPLPSAVPHPEDARRVRAEHFAADDGLVTMALALRGPQFATEATNRVPIQTPHAPRASAAAKPRPSAMPPAAIVGMPPAASTTAGSKDIKGASPTRCPPASRP